MPTIEILRAKSRKLANNVYSDEVVLCIKNKGLIFILLLCFNNLVYAQQTKDETSSENYSRFRLLTGAYDMVGKDPNFRYKNVFMNVNYKTSYFTDKSNPIKVKFSLEPGIYFASISEYDGKNVKEYSIHVEPYIRVGPELLLFNNIFINGSTGILAVTHSNGISPMVFVNANASSLIKLTEELNLEIELGVNLPFIFYGNSGTLYFSIGLSLFD